MTTLTDAEIAAMPQVAGAILADTVHWRGSEEERLYRECPSAFWLAPDGSDALPPIEYCVPTSFESPAVTSHPASVEGQAGAIGFAALIAGPVFISTMSLVIDGGGTPLNRIAMGVGLGLISFPFSIPVGALAAVLPLMLGVFLLTWLGTTHKAARLRRVWAATAAGMGTIFAAMFDAGIVTVPLVITSITCAMVAHRAIDWTDADPA